MRPAVRTRARRKVPRPVRSGRSARQRRRPEYFLDERVAKRCAGWRGSHRVAPSRGGNARRNGNCGHRGGMGQEPDAAVYGSIALEYVQRLAAIRERIGVVMYAAFP